MTKAIRWRSLFQAVKPRPRRIQKAIRRAVRRPRAACRGRITSV
jgi:hypothetical protein